MAGLGEGEFLDWLSYTLTLDLWKARNWLLINKEVGYSFKHRRWDTDILHPVDYFKRLTRNQVLTCFYEVCCEEIVRCYRARVAPSADDFIIMMMQYRAVVGWYKTHIYIY